MKKRLLITSIVMMLVVAVALSTATYAWFTSNAKVEASSMTLKAGVSDASALGIGWTGYGAGTSIENPVYGAALQPMAPTELSKNSTVAETLNFYTSTTKQEGGVYLFNIDATVDSDDQDNIADGLTAPVKYTVNNASYTAQSFYIKNLSNANTIGSVTVKAVFNDYMVQAAGENTVFEAGVEYYTKTGNTYTKYTDPYTAGETSLTDPAIYAYVPYVTTKDTVAIKGTKYYQLKTGATNAYEPVSVEVGASVAGKYEKVLADDMIRVALFTKEYRQANDGTATFSAQGSYYAYNPNTDVIEAVTGTPTEAAWNNYEYYTVSGANHILKCVLGKEDTKYVAVGAAPYDVNEVYFVKEGDVYTQTALTQAQYEHTDYAGKVYTATSTAGFGTIQANHAVKALTYYNDVVNEFVIASSLKPGDQVDIVAYAWLDGTMLDDSRTSQIGTVSLLFSAN